MTSYHNIYFIKKLMNNIRKSVIDGNFTDYKNDFLSRYNYSPGQGRVTVNAPDPDTTDERANGRPIVSAGR